MLSSFPAFNCSFPALCFPAFQLSTAAFQLSRFQSHFCFPDVKCISLEKTEWETEESRKLLKMKQEISGNRKL